MRVHTVFNSMLHGCWFCPGVTCAQLSKSYQHHGCHQSTLSPWICLCGCPQTQRCLNKLIVAEVAARNRALDVLPHCLVGLAAVVRADIKIGESYGFWGVTWVLGSHMIFDWACSVAVRS